MHLQRWPIDRIRRKQPRHRHDPLVLVEVIASRQKVVAACDSARSRGIKPGMMLAEARALCPALAHADYQPDQDLNSLEAFARWMMRFSPVVAVELPDALLLDVTGSERLFSGFDRLCRLVSNAISKLGFGHGIAIAPTPGAAWALASFGGDQLKIVTPEQLPDALFPLPTAALRLDGELIQAFGGLGVETVGQLMQLPRGMLPARFGTAVLTRLDQVRWNSGFTGSALGGAETPVRRDHQ